MKNILGMIYLLFCMFVFCCTVLFTFIYYIGFFLGILIYKFFLLPLFDIFMIVAEICYIPIFLIYDSIINNEDNEE